MAVQLIAGDDVRRLRSAFRPDYLATIEAARALVPDLMAGTMTFGDLEDELIRGLAGSDWERETEAREEIAILAGAVARFFEMPPNA